MGGLSIWHWLIVLLVVVLVFGTKKLANVGRDMGKAVKGFKDGMKEATEDDEPKVPQAIAQKKETADVGAPQTIDVQPKDAQQQPTKES